VNKYHAIGSSLSIRIEENGIQSAGVFCMLRYFP